ncbi:MAG: DUF1156 domain-containing protein [Candidatus Competibacter sp.]|nr:DUF1156 domain-containing protein [Candidatus Competibacter sp.]
MTDRRLIESAFPLKQTSLDSVHEKNVRHGHISTLHIWPARRPLAACRAALLATLLPDPETPAERQALCELIGGTVRQTVKKGKDGGDTLVEETVGGILHWKREQENAAVLDDLRGRIRAAFDGQAPKVLDPFAGGGAIPLEAMRLGCEVTAADINPVAWFILKCTLEYPQKLAGQTRRLPEFILNDREFMAGFFKTQGLGKKELERALEDLGHRQAQQTLAYLDLGKATLEADLDWHVRAWGQWVLTQARRELARFYPTYADFETLKPGHIYYEKRPMQLAPLTDDGLPDMAALNAEFALDYLKDERTPRWVAKPTVAYLWARTVTCKNSACRATVPLLKTRWLAKKDNKRVLLTMEPDADRKAVIFGIDRQVPAGGKTPAQRKEHDQTVSAGTMSRSGAKCPCCGTLMTMEDIRFEGRGGRLGAIMTAVVVDGQKGKEYRLPTPHEIAMAEAAGAEIERVFKDVPFGVPEEPVPQGASRKGGGSAFTAYLYGFEQWKNLFTPRQLVALGTLAKFSRKIENTGWKKEFIAYLAIGLDKLADYSSTICSWHNSGEKIGHTFARFALPILWDYAEVNPLSETSGGYKGCLDWVSRYIEHGLKISNKNNPTVLNISAINDEIMPQSLDIVVTDPPYYDAIPYSDLMDFFYVWLRRILNGLSPEIDQAFSEPLAPKWNHDTNDGELIDDAARFNGDKAASKQNYENGMARAFQACHAALKPDGRFVVVFAHKQPDAWETLASAMVKAGFVVTASWPIQTEMANRTRAMASAALASSIWMVCKKRPPTARPGWESPVLAEMRDHITQQLRAFWDAGIRGPDFVWAATGPALQAFSQYPVVKKASGGFMTIGEFLIHVRRFVVDFVVGRVLSRDNADGASAAAESLDALTAYYLLHRHDFGFEPAPIGQVILYGQSCGLSDRDLVQTWDLLASPKTAAAEASDDDEDATEEDTDIAQSGGATVKLKAWNQRKEKSLGYEAPGGRSIPLIDRIHRLMQLWKAGHVADVDEYLDANDLRQQELFKRVLQALIELALAGSEERAVLENLSNHIGVKIAKPESRDLPLNFEESPR